MKNFAKYSLVLSLFANFLSGAEVLWEDFKTETIYTFLPQIRGWCSKEKADYIMEFIREKKPSICLEIGTFAGSSTLPIARALQFNGHGILYSIDAWDNYVAIENLDAMDPNFIWLGSYNMQTVQSQCLSWIQQLNLHNICKLIQVRSEDLVGQLGECSLDLLYLDGNSSKEGSLLDATLYFSKVKYGGFILLPEGNHPNKKQTVSFLMNNATWLPEKSYKNQLLVFRKD